MTPVFGFEALFGITPGRRDVSCRNESEVDGVAIPVYRTR
jgi:hypothetical protein